MSFDSLLRHTLTIKRLAPVMTGGADKAGGASTTLTADVAAGSLAITIGSATDVTAGDWFRIGDAGEAEARQVASVASLVVTLTQALAFDHDSGDAVVELEDAGVQSLDEYGQPVFAPTSFATVRGRIQPRSAREVALASQGGAVIGSHVGYLRPLAGLSTGDWIEAAEMPGVRHDVLQIADAGGQGHHFELALQAVA
jgi:hypothetical protein